MTATLSAAVETPVSTMKGKAKATKVKSSRTTKSKPKPAEHPSTSEMVNTAVGELNEKGGSSLQAIKKFIATNYKVDLAKANIFIRKYIVSAVTAGKLVQTKGTGASGSFKLPGKVASVAKGKRSPPRKAKNPKTEVAENEATSVKKAKSSPKPKKIVAKKSKPASTKLAAKPTPKKLKTNAKPKKTLVKKPSKTSASKKIAGEKLRCNAVTWS